MRSVDGAAQRAGSPRVPLLIAAAGLVIAVAGAVVGIHLATEVRFDCGNLYRLVNLVCAHTVHPHARAGWLTVVICVFAGSALIGVGLVRWRRLVSDDGDHQRP